MKDTKIEWAHHTFNPWIGCTKVSPACDNCYAEKSMPAKFQGVTWGAGQPRKRTSQSNWMQPIRWNKEAERLGVRHRVFCASLADVFDNDVDPEWRAVLIDLIYRTPHLDWLLLTKRIGNAHRMLDEACRLALGPSVLGWANNPLKSGPMLDNVWLGATICNQAEADRDIPKLLDVPAAKRFLSIEPLLGPVDLTRLSPKLFAAKANALTGMWKWVEGPSRKETPALDWVIVGGESGPQARPMHPDWVRALRDQCQTAGVPFFFKQWGEWAPRDQWSYHVSMRKQTAIKFDGSPVSNDDAPQDVGGHRFEFVGKKSAGRLLDGREWNEVPA